MVRRAHSECIYLFYVRMCFLFAPFPLSHFLSLSLFDAIQFQIVFKIEWLQEKLRPPMNVLVYFPLIARVCVCECVMLHITHIHLHKRRDKAHKNWKPLSYKCKSNGISFKSIVDTILCIPYEFVFRILHTYYAHNPKQRLRFRVDAHIASYQGHV